MEACLLLFTLQNYAKHLAGVVTSATSTNSWGYISYETSKVGDTSHTRRVQLGTHHRRVEYSWGHVTFTTSTVGGHIRKKYRWGHISSATITVEDTSHPRQVHLRTYLIRDKYSWAHWDTAELCKTLSRSCHIRNKYKQLGTHLIRDKYSWGHILSAISTVGHIGTLQNYAKHLAGVVTSATSTNSLEHISSVTSTVGDISYPQ
jgi:hypothetical protein